MAGHKKREVTEKIFNAVIQLIGNGLRNTEIATALGYSDALISRIRRTETWANYQERKRQVNEKHMLVLMSKDNHTKPEENSQHIEAPDLEFPSVEQSLRDIVFILAELKECWKPKEEKGWKLPFNK